ncbi:hypothetical protein EOL96_00815 [Candidatus Saccharibacteria bacterium]|nr:hypothetical protein [Candidatus Saccharibacteria bacterium]
MAELSLHGQGQILKDIAEMNINEIRLYRADILRKREAASELGIIRQEHESDKLLACIAFELSYREQKVSEGSDDQQLAPAFV